MILMVAEASIRAFETAALLGRFAQTVSELGTTWSD
jgi:hypothetical protein